MSTDVMKDLLEALKEVEWADIEFDYRGDAQKHCPSCGAQHKNGHHTTCCVKNAIARAESTLAEPQPDAGLIARDDVNRMARESGLLDWALHDRDEKILRFAHLVIADFLQRTGQYVTNDASREAALEQAKAEVESAATERANERANASWALMCEKMVAAEREACAQIVQSECIGFTPEDDQINCIVAAIRARSIQPPKGGD